MPKCDCGGEGGIILNGVPTCQTCLDRIKQGNLRNTRREIYDNPPTFRVNDRVRILNTCPELPLRGQTGTLRRVDSHAVHGRAYQIDADNGSGNLWWVHESYIERITEPTQLFRIGQHVRISDRCLIPEARRSEAIIRDIRPYSATHNLAYMVEVIESGTRWVIEPEYLFVDVTTLEHDGAHGGVDVATGRDRELTLDLINSAQEAAANIMSQRVDNAIRSSFEAIPSEQQVHVDIIRSHEQVSGGTLRIGNQEIGRIISAEITRNITEPERTSYRVADADGNIHNIIALGGMIERHDIAITGRGVGLNL